MKIPITTHCKAVFIHQKNILIRVFFAMNVAKCTNPKRNQQRKIKITFTDFSFFVGVIFYK